MSPLKGLVSVAAIVAAAGAGLWAGQTGLLAVSPSDASAEEAPRKGDLETARLFGKRVAETATKLRG